jgi:sugar O-acyltransferase (sialic acid O-acetyltransferase NeuD family)
MIFVEMMSAQECCGSAEMINEQGSTSQSIILIGGGLHAGVVLDLIEAINELEPRYVVYGFYDDNQTNLNLSISYLGTIEQLVQQCIEGNAILQSSFAACIGDNVTREKIVERICNSVADKRKLAWVTLVHPFSSVSRSASVSHGTVVCAGAIIGPNTRVGIHTIINTHASVDHDCNVGDYVHIAPGVHLCGTVNIGNLTLVGVGCQIIPKICIGQKSIIGAGTTVLANVADMTRAVGIVKSAKKTNMGIDCDRLFWLPKKLPNFSRIEHLLVESINQNHFANFGPCVRQLEIVLRNIFEINLDKAIILTCNGTAALHAIIGGFEIYYNKKLKFATQAFTFPTSVQGLLIGSIIVDVDNGGGLNLDQIDVESVDGIVVTNAFGHVVDIKKYTDWASKYGKHLVFDNAATSFTFYQGEQNILIYFAFKRHSIKKPQIANTSHVSEEIRNLTL